MMNPESMLKQLTTDGIPVRGVLVNDVNVQKAKPTLYSDVEYPDDSSTSQSGATYITEIITVCCCATILSLTMCYIACHRRQEGLSPNILDKQDVDRSDAEAHASAMPSGKCPPQRSSSTPLPVADDATSCSNNTSSDPNTDENYRQRSHISNVAIADIYLASLKLATSVDMTSSMLDGWRRPPPPAPQLPMPPTPAISPTSSPDTGVAPQAGVLDAGVLLAGTKSSRAAALKARPVPSPSSVARSQRWPIRRSRATVARSYTSNKAVAAMQPRPPHPQLPSPRGMESLRPPPPAPTYTPPAVTDGPAMPGQSRTRMPTRAPQLTPILPAVDGRRSRSLISAPTNSAHGGGDGDGGLPLAIASSEVTVAALTPLTHASTPIGSGPGLGHGPSDPGPSFRELAVGSTPAAAAAAAAVGSTPAAGAGAGGSTPVGAAAAANREYPERFAGTPVVVAAANTPLAPQVHAVATVGATDQRHCAPDQPTRTLEEASPPLASPRPSPASAVPPRPPQPAATPEAAVVATAGGSKRSRLRNRRSGLALAAQAVTLRPLQLMRSPPTWPDTEGVKAPRRSGVDGPDPSSDLV